MKIKYILLLLVLITITSCCDDKKEDPLPKRTVLCYMVESNLGTFLQANVKDMMAIASNKNLNGGNLLVFYSKGKEEAELFQIKEGKGGAIIKHHIKDYTNQSAISPEVMRSIVKDAFTLYPAESYGLLFSSHGTSWLPADIDKMLRSFGEEDGNNMEIYDMAEALSIFNLDFLAFDACSMGGIECMYELKDVADYILSSSAEIMGVGFPFKSMLPYFFTEKADLEKAAFYFNEYYTQYANPYGCISVTKTSELDQLAAITKEIIVSAGGEQAMYNQSVTSLQTLCYLGNSPARLSDFGDLMNNLATEEQKTRWNNALNKAIISKYHTDRIFCRKLNDIPVDTFSGLSIYVMRENLTQLNDWYRGNLKWYQAVYQ